VSLGSPIGGNDALLSITDLLTSSNRFYRVISR
jgi:hypothetical protein